MKITLFTLLIFALVLSCTKDNNVPETPIKPEPVANPEFITEICKIPAPSLKGAVYKTDTTKGAKIYLPPFYKTDTLKRYPVVYFVHGFGGSYNEADGIMQAAYQKMKDKSIKEFIIVSLSAYTRFGGSFCVNSVLNGNWEDYVTGDVISYIDLNYRTIANRNSRAISGFSMGGFSALYLGFRNADIYGLSYAISPGVMKNDALKTTYNQWKSLSGFINAYGAAFSPNLALTDPFVEKPKFDDTYEDSLIINKWLDGFGNFDKKVDAYLNGIPRLNKIALDYGTSDYYSWIPTGCIYLESLLEKNSIPYVSYQKKNGVHEINLTQVNSYMLPFFSDNLEQQK